MQAEQVLFSLPLSRLEPIFKKWVSDVINESQSFTQSNQSIDEFVDLDEACKIAKVAKQTMYQNKKIKRYKRFGRLYFLRSELEAYLTDGLLPVKK